MMIVGTLKLTLILRGAYSLKDKRRVIKSLKDRINSKFNVSIAEIEANDQWQKAVLGVALVGNERRYVNSVLSQVVNYICQIPACELVKQELEIL